MIIRNRSSSDGAALEAIARQTHQLDSYPLYLPGDLRSFIVNEAALGAWVATSGDEVLGHVALHRGTAEEVMDVVRSATGLADGSIAFVARLLVAPAARRQGVGRALLETAAEAASRLGRRAALDVVEDHGAAIALYEDCGWHRVGRVEWKLPDGRPLRELVYLSPEPLATRAALGTIQALARYPVKSVLGEHCDQVGIVEGGLEFDRAMAIYDRDGRIASGKTTRRFRRMANLFQLRSWVEDGTIRVGTPAGGAYQADDPAAWAAVSEVLGEPVEIRPESEVSHKDDAPIHLITTASLRWVETLRPGFDGASERFRPNAVVDVAGTGRVEDAWVGARIQVGSCVLRVTKRVERCVMPTLAQEGLPRLPGLLKVLTERSDACLGVYAKVEQPGQVATGDPVRLL